MEVIITSRFGPVLFQRMCFGITFSDGFGYKNGSVQSCFALLWKQYGFGPVRVQTTRFGIDSKDQLGHKSGFVECSLDYLAFLADRFPVSVHAAVRFGSCWSYGLGPLRFMSVRFVRFDSVCGDIIYTHTYE